MKSLLLNDYATPTGGAELSLLALRDGLRRRGHDARLFASSVLPGSAPSQADYSCFGTTSRFRTLLQAFNPWAYLRLRDTLKKFAPDVVHVNVFLTQLSPSILPLIRNIPSIYHAHWNRPVCLVGTKMLPDGTPCQTPAGVACLHNRCVLVRDWFPLMFQTWLWRRWRCSFDIFIASSESVKRLLLAEEFSPVKLIRCGVPAQSNRQPLSNPPTIGFVGRLVRQKGVDVLVRAFEMIACQIADARLLLIGEGPERESLERLVAERGLSDRIIFLGMLPREQADAACNAAWVQVVPSVYQESSPLVIGEAMMRGTAVIATDCGGNQESVQHERTGLLVPPSDTRLLADALLRILLDRNRAEQMGEAGRSFAMVQWSEDAFIEQFVQLYESLTRHRSDKKPKP